MTDNLDALRDHLDKLDRLHRDGILADDDHRSARQEIEQRIVAAVRAYRGPLATRARQAVTLALAAVMAVAASLTTAAVTGAPGEAPVTALAGAIAPAATCLPDAGQAASRWTSAASSSAAAPSAP